MLGEKPNCPLTSKEGLPSEMANQLFQFHYGFTHQSKGDRDYRGPGVNSQSGHSRLGCWECAIYIDHLR